MVASMLVFIASCEAGFISFPKPIEAVLNYLGSRSYSLYLVHMPMLTLTQEIMLRYTEHTRVPVTSQLFPQYFGLALALSFVATEVIYRTIEMPMLAKGKKISERLLDSNGAPAREPQEVQRDRPLEINAGALAE